VEIVAGIDEAGLGPVLGPLVVSASVFSVPDEHAGRSLWQLLSAAVSRSVTRRATRIAIADSKKLYTGLRGSKGLANLERGVLAALSALGFCPGTFKELLGQLCPIAVKAAANYQWYGGLDLPLPRRANPLEVQLAGNSLARAMKNAGLALEDVFSEVVLEGEFNHLTMASNKSVMLFDVTCRLLMRIWRQAGGRKIRVFVDRQGGRMHYLPALQRVFEGCSFKIVEESQTDSVYCISEGGKAMEIGFSVDCEDKHLPAALASMASKYIRELFMGVLNMFWASHVSDLPPTAGYYSDGNRFYRAILPAVRRMGIDEWMLYRQR
jgi:hypothetical protein